MFNEKSVKFKITNPCFQTFFTIFFSTFFTEKLVEEYHVPDVAKIKTKQKL
jgi:hypothetical protein